MFNLIVGDLFEGSQGIVDRSRFLENLDRGSEPPLTDLSTFPALRMPERDAREAQEAQLGHVAALTTTNRDVRFRFLPNGLPSISVEDLWRIRSDLGLTDWDFSRTRWLLETGDLYQVLAEHGLAGGPQARPTAFRLPNTRPRADHAALMMPFAGFNDVHRALREACESAGYICRRADDLWKNAKVMDDIALLIAESSVIICDLTGRNSNVFYEAGLAHMLGRQTVLISQSKEDIPFDLQGERYLTYYPNAQGLEDLKSALVPRLAELRGER